METIAEQDIQEIALSSPFFRAKVERFLEDNGLRPEVLEFYYTIQSSDGSILAGAGLSGDVIKCVAVSSALRSEGLLAPLLSHLISEASARGILNLKVFTKPEYKPVFESLGFRLLASAPLAVFMENGRGLEEYCSELRRHPAPGVIIMNANPFTLGHRYLVETALSCSEAGASCPAATGHLNVIAVREDLSEFPYAERLEMMRRGCEGLASVVEGSAYQISAATFPTYFLKDLPDAAETQMRLDIDLFGRWIAPALGATVRFVGSEPADPLTARYNALMKEMLPAYGIKVVEIPRLEDSEGKIVSASRVREALAAGRLTEAAALVPESSRPFLLAALAERALRMELDTPSKPGLVGPDSSGAHSDMDYGLMLRSIRALRPYWSRMAEAESVERLRSLGIAAEEAMLAATGGVNAHRGAIFALGLALNASWSATKGCKRVSQNPDIQALIKNDVGRIAYIIFDKSLTDKEIRNTPQSHGEKATETFGVKGARQMALEGYEQLFEDWLPYFRSLKDDEGSSLKDDEGSSLKYDEKCGGNGNRRALKTLLRIMSTLDDTCIIHRVGYDRAQQVKAQAAKIAGKAGNDAMPGAINSVMPDQRDSVMPDALGHLCAQYAAEGISPGGAADMLALTIFIDSITN